MHFDISNRSDKDHECDGRTDGRTERPLAIIYKKIFGTMAKDSYGQISKYFGVPSVEQLITNRHDRFLNRYRCQENYVCQALIIL